MIAHAAALAALLLAAPVRGTPAVRGAREFSLLDEETLTPFGMDARDIVVKGVNVRGKDHLLTTSSDQLTLIVSTSNTAGVNLMKGLGTEVADDLMAASSVSIINVQASDAERIMDALQADDNIRSVELDSAVHLPPDEGPDDARHSRRLEEQVPYGIDMVFENDRAWLDSLPAPEGSIKVCVVDTGYDVGHVDLPSVGVTGFSPYGDNEKWDTDGNGHGSHCAGTIAATGNDQGVVGVIPNMDASEGKFSFHIGKGLTNGGSGSWSGVIAAAQSCSGAGAKVISMSLGGSSNSAAMQDAFKQMYEEHDVLIIAAAGNGGNGNYLFPASLASVMSVAAVDSSRSKASFSQFNDQVEIAGPGVGVKSTLPGDNYAAWSGTSMACPHVAGVAGFLRAYFPACKNFQIRHALTVTSVHDSGTGTCDNNLGFGIVSAKAAYTYLLENDCGVDDPHKPAVGGCAENSCTEDSTCDDNDDSTTDQCLSGGCVFTVTPPSPPPTPAPTPPTGGDGPGSGVPAPINIDLFLLEFDFIAEEACVYTDLTQIPGGPTSGQCAQACASLANCDGFVQLEAGTCAMTAEVTTGQDCSNDDATNVWFYDRKVVMHMD